MLARRVKKESDLSSASVPAAHPGAQKKAGDSRLRLHLAKSIAELLRLHELLLTNEVDPDVLSDLRDAVNRVRNTAWAAQQYVVCQNTDQGATSLRSLLAGERVRASYQLCQALSDDLKKNDVEFQRGSIVQLHEIMRTLTEQLKNIIDKM